jgi:hypothetical protein
MNQQLQCRYFDPNEAVEKDARGLQASVKWKV